jgi:hypothetical protein
VTQEIILPKVTMFFDETFYQHTSGKSVQIGREIQRLVAEAASTDEVILDPVNDVDFIPQPYPRGTLVANPISFEIEAIGYPARKAKLTKDAMHCLKREIADLLHRVNVDIPLHENALLIWLKYVDKDGLHV